MSRSVGVVVPAYRPDRSVLVAYLGALQAEIDPADLRVELDQPEERTVEALRETGATVNVVESRRGKGQALTDGFEALDTDVLAFADADGSTPAESVRNVIDQVRVGEVDLAAGSRRHPDADVQSHQTVFRQHLGDVFAWLARRLLDVSLRDYQCGAKAMTRETWQAIRPHLYQPGFAWDIEVLAVADTLGYTIREVPVTWIDHPDSTVTTTDAVPELLRALVVTRRRARRLGAGTEPDESGRTEPAPLINRVR
ncbi:glycosyltransferase [Halodesulfurarchaeum sp. HSR-GB]|uniref:glycosyltransferase n=1 Tax=Halodesulfurarchaeum sp. HSR-GB TaxID=3074077 RepID=UPI00286202B2|nr:glycosyltransferase [Halodesulfurarchaeum sp. HSR-GB]MDR5657203.1 glycosyltransferase [Halodesulfurarchaeum sp. HSR-GB]